MLPLLLSQDEHDAGVLDAAGAGPSAEGLVVDTMFEAVTGSWCNSSTSTA